MTKAYSTESQPLSFTDGGSLPDDPNAPITLPEALLKVVEKEIGNSLIFLDRHASATTQSYGQLLEESSRILAGIKASDLPLQSQVIILLEDNSKILATFWGCILGGFVPIIAEVPPIGQTVHPTIEKLNNLQRIFSKSLIIISENRHDLIQSINCNYVQSHRFALFEEVSSHSAEHTYHSPHPDDLACLILSSGSTGMPKCIELTHRNLLARARGANLLNQHKPQEIILNWLPFDHIGSISDWHIRCLLLGCRCVYVQKELILGRIFNWLDLIDRFRVTHSWAPTFAYSLINDQLENERLLQQEQKTWDLSCIQCLLNAGEIVKLKVMQDFHNALAIYGLKETAIRSAFGMAELASGVTYSQPKDKLLAFRPIKSSVLEEEPNQRIFANLGVPIPGVSIRIVDSMNQILPEGNIGYLQVKGEPVFNAYFHNVEASKEAFSDDDWFQTGDLGFCSNGNLVLTGRAKDIIVLNGVNYYGHEIEAVVEKIEDVNTSYTAVCSVQEIDHSAEKVAIFFNCDFPNGEQLLKLLKVIRYQVVSQVGINPDYLIPLPKSAIPKTTIGKIQRNQLRDRFEAGEFALLLEQISRISPKKKISSQAEIEFQVVQIWQSVLEKKVVGLQDNFFELGGHSFLLPQIQYLLEEKFGINLAITNLFRYPTIRSLARYLSQNKQDKNQFNQPQRKTATQSQEIAVIGMACRFPGADCIEEFWQNLCQGVESISFFSESEIISSGLDAKLVKNTNYIKANPIISNIENFDAHFFGYTAKEAELLDPQHRILLECAWESLENAGYNPLIYPGLISFYAGTGMNTYLLNNIYPNRHRLDSNDSLNVIDLDSFGGFQMMVANDKDYLTTRVSYKLNLTGPSVNVQTACSTSLAAIHLACQSLINDECDLAIAGGVSVQIPQISGYLYQEGMLLSPDGHCRAFDAQAKGTIFGNGVGVVVLKPLAVAIQDRDHIYAVIKGSALGNDGGNKVSYLAPNGEGQSRVVREALLKAGVEAETIGYVEAHGTGTILGDPIEVDALTQAFHLTTQKTGYCAIGSVKTNVGHLQIASGIAGFIKTVLSLYHQQIPASLNFQNPNPQIDFAHSPFYVNTSLKDWSPNSHPRRAGVNSLGIGGTNVHVILEEPPLGKIESSKSLLLERPYHILSLSAKNEMALQDLIHRYENHLSAHLNDSLADICFTANTGRVHMPYRLVITANSTQQVQEKLKLITTVAEIPKQCPQIAFLFSDQDPSLRQIGHELYRTQPTFRETINYCHEILYSYLDRSLVDELYFELDNCCQYNCLVLFTLEYALFKLWKSWGVETIAVMGEGLGEYVAACVAGIFSLEDCFKLLVAREYSTQANFEKTARAIVYCSPQLNIISSMTGDWATEEISTAGYWCTNFHRSIKLVDGLKTLYQAGYNCFIECSSQPKLLDLGQGIFPDDDRLLWLPSLSPRCSDWQQLLQSLGQLYLEGVEIDWIGFDKNYIRHRLELPTYPFQRQRYWIEPTSYFTFLGNQSFQHPLLGSKIPSASSDVIFQSSLSLETNIWLNDHQINQTIILPGSVYIEMALVAGKDFLKTTMLSLDGFNISQGLILSKEYPSTLQLILSKRSEEVFFEIYSLLPNTENNWRLHCSGKITRSGLRPRSKRIDLLKAEFSSQLGAKAFYEKCRGQGLEYGESFRCIQQIWIKDNKALAQVVLETDLISDLSIYQLHPRLLDSCLQVVLASFPPQLISGTYVPIAIEHLTFHRPFQQFLWSYAQLRSIDHEMGTVTADLEIFDEQGNLIVQIKGLSSKQFTKKDKIPRENLQDLLYTVDWCSQNNDSIPAVETVLGCWLIFADRGGIAEQLSTLLKINNQDCRLVYPSSENLLEIENDLLSSRVLFRGVIYLWSVDLLDNLESIESINHLESHLELVCKGVLSLVQTLIKQRNKNPDNSSSRIWLVTRGTQKIDNALPSPINIFDATLWGMGKVINSEHPELNCVCIDLDTIFSIDEVQRLWLEICSSGEEKQVAFRGGVRYVPRLTRFPVQPEQPSQLIITSRGTLDNLDWQPLSRRQPSLGEVEVKVRATGLNFRDILNILGMYPLAEDSASENLGLECVGEVVAIGDKVDGLVIGDRVMGLALGDGFNDFVIVRESDVIPIPDFLTFEEAATIPGAFLTAYYTLVVLARLQPGERVLIHAAAGGVGLAAVQIAQKIGAEVFATASTGKWKFLQSMGVKIIMNSRDLTFGQKITEETQGEGVDVVLNCLSGDFIAMSLSVLRKNGRFIEIGKQEILTMEQVSQVRPDAIYLCFDLLTLARSQPDIIQSTLQQIILQFQLGSLSPLPYQTFSPQKIKEAFRSLQQAKHIGKIIVSRESGKPNALSYGNGSYLITGGLGALGLFFANWLVAKGARFLILVGRNEPSPEACLTLRQIEAKGVNLLILEADVSRPEDVLFILESQSSQGFPALRGIIHAAGVLEDGMIMSQRWEKICLVIKPKVLGAWNLHQLTQKLPLDFFLLFSSAASLLGTSGQIGYAAANTFLDALAHARQGMGLPGLSINWGAWRQIGMAARQTVRSSFLAMGEIDPVQGLIALEKALPQALSQIAIMQIDWNEKNALDSSFFANFTSDNSQSGISQKTSPILIELIAKEPSKRKKYLLTYIRSQVAQTLGLNSSYTIPNDCPFFDLGIDSLTSVELRNRLQINLCCSLSSTLIFDYPTVIKLVDYLSEKLFLSDNEKLPTFASTKNTKIEVLESLSESQAELLLLDELKDLQ